MIVGSRYEPIEPLFTRGLESWSSAIDHLLGEQVTLVTVARPAPATFLERARTLAAVDHPRVPPILRFGADADAGWVVSPPLTGEVLSWERHARGLSPFECALLLAPLAEALDACHDQGVCHGRIEPDVVWLDGRKLPSLGGFSLARGPGSPRYSAPEILDGASASAAADQYAFASIVAFLVAGVPPRDASDTLDRLQHVVEPDFLAALRRARAVDPAERFPTCAALMDALGVDLKRISRAELPSVRADAPLRVLVVEDEATDFLIVERQLTRSDLGRFEVAQARRVSEIPALVEAVQPHVILLDLGLPDSCGLATVQRALELAPDLPIVLQTADDEEEIAEAAVALGAQDFVPKGPDSGRGVARALLYAFHRHGLARGDASTVLQDRETGLLIRAVLIDRLEGNLAHAERRGAGAALALLEPAVRGSSPRALLAGLEPWESLGLLGPGKLGFTAEFDSPAAARKRLKELTRGPVRWRIRLSTSPEQGTTSAELLESLGL